MNADDHAALRSEVLVALRDQPFDRAAVERRLQSENNPFDPALLGIVLKGGEPRLEDVDGAALQRLLNAIKGA